MDIFRPFLESQGGVVMLDGGLATQLEAKGEDLGSELWSAVGLQRFPSKIQEVHREYYEAGADVAITSSYQATFDGFGRKGLSRDEAGELMRRSVELGCAARDEFWAAGEHPGRQRPLVAASVGSYGAALADGSEYRGDYGLSVEELMEWHRPRMELLAGAGADLLALETIPCKVEAEALLRLLPTAGGGLPAWLSFSCADGASTCGGDPLVECARLAGGVRECVAVGVNCTAPQLVESLLAEARKGCSKPLLAYPNRGERWDEVGRQFVPGTAASDGEMAGRVAGWRAAAGGAGLLLGGCCRTTPATITVLRHAALQP